MESVPLALGTGPLGNQYQLLEDAQAHATIEAALEAGIRRYDTAPHYGAGVAERRLGAALAGVPRARFEISTKVGRRLVPRVRGQAKSPAPFLEDPDVDRRWDFSRDGVLRSLEASLARLALDAVETVYLHDPDEHWDEASSEGYATLHELRDQGVVTSIGVGMTDAANASRYVRETDIDRVLIAGRYTLLEHDAAALELLDLCSRRGVAVVAGGVLNSGILADPRPGAPYEYEPAPQAILARATGIAASCARAGVPVLAAALRFPLGHPAVTEVVVGARTPEEVRTNARLLRDPVPDALWDALREDGWLSPHVPAPTGLPPA
jgi:D-threo-aldose 1-dehydrogenase